MAFSETTNDVLVQGDNLVALNAGEDVTAGQVVKVGSDLGVQPSDTDGETVHGVALQTVSSGNQVTVAMVGTICRLQSGSGGVSAGDPLASHGATGEEGQVDTGDATGDSLIGHALEADGGSQGNTFLAEIQPAEQVN